MILTGLHQQKFCLFCASLFSFSSVSVFVSVSVSVSVFVPFSFSFSGDFFPSFLSLAAFFLIIVVISSFISMA